MNLDSPTVETEVGLMAENIPNQNLSGNSEKSGDSVTIEVRAISAAIRKLLDNPTLENAKHIKELASLIEYQLIYGRRFPWKPSEPLHLAPTRCSQCNGGMPLFNVRAAHREYDWRCLSHIPSDLIFPIGLHGEERKATGRS